ncbi:MAG TPA: ABC transporter permease [Nevskiaceae bacterium]|nr:ABC transporter permease [Nevskiaceae bacterium]
MILRMLAITGMNLKSLPARWGTALVVVVCLTGVTGVLVSLLGMAQGFEKTFGAAGRADRVVVLSTGQNTDLDSSITREQAPLLMSAPGFAHGQDGKPLAMLERFTVSDLPNARTGKDETLIVRGVGANVLGVRPEAHVIDGHRFTPGLREIVIGRATVGRFKGLALGQDVELSGVIWKVVGVFEEGGSAHESEAWGDVEAVMTAYNQDSYSALVGMLASDASFQVLKDAITANPKLSHTPLREPAYYERQGGVVSTAMRVLGYFVAVIMAIGAVFAAIDTMYASVEVRSVEIATLRALGFEATPIVMSVLLECIVLCAIGALIGGAIAFAAFNGFTASTIGGGTGTRVSFQFSIGADLLAQAIVWACVIGLLGGLMPALRAARMPIVEALRET